MNLHSLKNSQAIKHTVCGAGTLIYIIRSQGKLLRRFRQFHWILQYKQRGDWKWGRFEMRPALFVIYSQSDHPPFLVAERRQQQVY